MAPDWPGFRCFWADWLLRCSVGSATDCCWMLPSTLGNRRYARHVAPTASSMYFRLVRRHFLMAAIRCLRIVAEGFGCTRNVDVVVIHGRSANNRISGSMGRPLSAGSLLTAFRFIGTAPQELKNRRRAAERMTSGELARFLLKSKA